jgi:tripartite-type tricarboxylate transporter receptor subunit TctC
VTGAGLPKAGQPSQPVKAVRAENRLQCSSVWQGLSAPKNTPAAVVEQLNTEINAALANREFVAHFAQMGGSALRVSPAGYAKLIADETEKWAKVIQAANIKPL